MLSLRNASMLARCFAQVCERLPAVTKVYDEYGQLTIADYLQRTLRFASDSLQSRADLIEAVYRYASSLLDETLAENAAQELQSLPVALTANHHGVDFLAQSVQGGLIFSLRKIADKPASTVPVFACGNVPLNNSTYPQGLLLYHLSRQRKKTVWPIHLPIFPNRLKRSAVSAAVRYDAEMLNRAERRATAMLQDEQLTRGALSIIESIFERHYRHPSIMGLSSYSQQAVVLNNRIWRDCLGELDQPPELIYLELEKITNVLLERDLSNEDCLIWQLMFNPALRTRTLQQLDGAKVCWHQAKLVESARLSSDDKGLSSKGGGTVFFWAINNTGWRVPLMLTGRTTRSLALQGRDERGKLWCFSFKPKEILRALRAGRLIPSLFTCYTTISLARGVSCCGGYFQAEYLPSIQQGLIQVLLDGLAGFKREAELLSKVFTDISLVGMQTVMHRGDEEHLMPAGPIEIIASGGLRLEQINRIQAMVVEDALLAGIMETWPDILERRERRPDWHLYLAKECSRVLGNRCITI